MPNSEAAEPAWLPPELLIRINAEQVAETGEPHLVLSPALLESAWARPLNLWSYQGEADLVRLAVALMVGVAQNHPFQQGNKRAAFAAGLALLDLNGWRIDRALDAPELADLFVAVIAHALSEADFAERLRPHVRPLI